MENHRVGERDTPRRAVILARHRAINTSRWVAQQANATVALSSALGPIKSAILGPPLHGGPQHRAPKPPRSSHPPKSVLVVRCSTSHSFLLCSLSIDAAFLLTHSERPRSFLLQPVEIKG
jgi:hypothetical protein